MNPLNTQPLQDEDGFPGAIPFELVSGEPYTNGNQVLIQLVNVSTQEMDGYSKNAGRVTPEMFRQQFNGMGAFPIVAALPTDFADNLSGKRSGNMSPHMYNNAALPYWENVTQDSNYYPAHSDAEIIANHTSYFQALGEELRKDRDIVYVEMGVGGDYSLDHKTIPMIRALGATDVGLLDYSESAIGHAAFYMAENHADLKRHTLMRNFNTQSYGHLLPENERRVFGLMGCTLGNFEGPSNIDVPQSLSQYFAHYRGQMNKGDILILSVDHNLDQTSLFRAYNGSFDRWVHQMKGYLATNFKGSGYDPNNFNYQKVWDIKNHNLMFGFVPPKDGIVKIDGISVPYVGGRMQIYLNSRRFVQSDLNEAYKRTEVVDVATHRRHGLELINVLPDKNKYISLQVLRAT